METLPPSFEVPDWVDVHEEADRETYEAALAAGDLAICASDYETMPRTPFEQAASGQVLILRDREWVYDCVPEDYPLVVDGEGLTALAVTAVENWEEAVAANRQLVHHVQAVRSPTRAGRRTYDDLRRRVEEKCARYDGGDVLRVVESTLAAVDAGQRGHRDEDADRECAQPDKEGGDGSISVDYLIERTAAQTADGRPLVDRQDVAFSDVVYALRSLGYEDVGNPGTPRFRPKAKQL